MHKMLILLAAALVAACGDFETVQDTEQADVVPGVETPTLGVSDAASYAESEGPDHRWYPWHWHSDHLQPTVSRYQDHVDIWASMETPIKPIISLDACVDIYVVEADYGFINWLGKATIYPDLEDREHIVMAKVEINRWWFDVPENPLGLTDVEAALAHIRCHELGHTLGLGHNREQLDTCMNDCLDIDTYTPEWVACTQGAPKPNENDARVLRNIYRHKDESRHKFFPCRYRWDWATPHPHPPAVPPQGIEGVVIDEYRVW